MSHTGMVSYEGNKAVITVRELEHLPLHMSVTIALGYKVLEYVQLTEDGSHKYVMGR